MVEENLKGLDCNFALQNKDNPNGAAFWKRGIYECENSTHYFFKVAGRLEAYLKTNVIKIEFQAAPANGGAAGRGAI